MFIIILFQFAQFLIFRMVQKKLWMIDLCSIEVADEFDLQHRVVFRFLTKQKSTHAFCVHNSAQKSGSQLPEFRRLDFCTQNLADFCTDKIGYRFLFWEIWWAGTRIFVVFNFALKKIPVGSYKNLGVSDFARGDILVSILYPATRKYGGWFNNTGIFFFVKIALIGTRKYLVVTSREFW